MLGRRTAATGFPAQRNGKGMNRIGKESLTCAGEEWQGNAKPWKCKAESGMKGCGNVCHASQGVADQGSGKA